METSLQKLHSDSCLCATLPHLHKNVIWWRISKMFWSKASSLKLVEGLMKARAASLKWTQQLALFAGSSRCEVQMRAVVARASPASQPASSAQLRSFPTRGEDGRTCGSRSWEALMMAQHTDQWRLNTFSWICVFLRDRASPDSDPQRPVRLSALKKKKKPFLRIRGRSTQLLCAVIESTEVRGSGNVGMATSGAHKCPKSEKLDEAQALAKSCAGRPDFLPCDGLSICATHSHGKCFKLHWCCHLGWCHCKFMFPCFRWDLHHQKTMPVSLIANKIEIWQKNRLLKGGHVADLYFNVEVWPKITFKTSSLIFLYQFSWFKSLYFIKNLQFFHLSVVTFSVIF